MSKPITQEMKDFRTYVRERRKGMKDLFVPDILMAQLPWRSWFETEEIDEALYKTVERETRELTGSWLEICAKTIPEMEKRAAIRSVKRMKIA